LDYLKQGVKDGNSCIDWKIHLLQKAEILQIHLCFVLPCQLQCHRYREQELGSNPKEFSAESLDRI